MRVTDLDTPAVIIDTDLMERNLRRLAGYCAEHKLNLRPHTKTHKIPELARKQLQYGAAGITVAKLGEAEVMADGGLEDILIAYPLVGNTKWERLVLLAERVRVTVSTDSFEIARDISALAHAKGVTIGVLVEFDTGFGRCGLPIDASSMIVVGKIADLRGVNFRGVMVYPGHFLTGEEERERLLAPENARMLSLMDLLHTARIECPVVSGGSTPVAYMAHRLAGINEIRAGTYIFNDKKEVCCGVATYGDCAAAVLTTVVSTSVPGKAIVDGGSKTFSSDRLPTGDQKGFGHVLEDPGVYFEAMSEEHGYLNLARAEKRFKVGSRVRIIPNHICACINMHDKVYGVEGDQVVVEWRVAARGKVN